MHPVRIGQLLTLWAILLHPSIHLWVTPVFIRVLFQMLVLGGGVISQADLFSALIQAPIVLILFSYLFSKSPPAA